MSLTRFFNEPFYSTADFDRLFDEAFNRNNPRGQVERQTNGTSFLRPRYGFSQKVINAATCILTCFLSGWMSMKTPRITQSRRCSSCRASRRKMFISTCTIMSSPYPANLVFPMSGTRMDMQSGNDVMASSQEHCLCLSDFRWVHRIISCTPWIEYWRGFQIRRTLSRLTWRMACWRWHSQRRRLRPRRRRSPSLKWKTL